MAATIAVPVAVLTDDVLLALVNATWEAGEKRAFEFEPEETAFIRAADKELTNRGRTLEVDVAGVLYFTK